MNVVIAWIRSNVASVIFIALMIAAIVALPYVAGRMNASVQKDMTARMGQLTELQKLEKTSVKITPLNGPPIEESVLINENLLARLKEVTEAEREDASRVLEAARLHNRKDRGVLHESVFPEPPPAEREVLPLQFHRRLTQAYEQLLHRLNAGSPPDVETMAEKIERTRQNFLTQTLQKSGAEGLDADEQAQLRDVLTKQRMSLYAEQAERIGVYATVDALRVPAWEQTRLPPQGELFEWQWQYWVVEDLLAAIGDANLGPGDARYSVLQAPVKRVLDIAVYAAPAPRAAGAPSPSAEVRPDYAVSFTGRVTNPLFDVRDVELRLVVDTARLPVVFDALARRNFITILDADLIPADHYAAARDGFFYGSEPVAELTLQLETIWLRSWTGEFMPDETKQALGVPLPRQPAGG